MVRPPDLKELEEEIERMNGQKEEAVANQDFEKAARLRDQADKLKKKKENAHARVARKVARRPTASSTPKSSPRSSPR